MENKLHDDLLKFIKINKLNLLLKTDSFLVQITSSYNQKYFNYENISTLLLSDCEINLKKGSYITENEILLILKVEQYKQYLLFPIITYQVFHPITKEPLDLNYCKNTKINLLIHVKIEKIICKNIIHQRNFIMINIIMIHKINQKI